MHMLAAAAYLGFALDFGGIIGVTSRDDKIKHKFSIPAIYMTSYNTVECRFCYPAVAAQAFCRVSCQLPADPAPSGPDQIYMWL